MWVDFRRIDGSLVKVRCDRIVAVSELPNGSGPPLAWVHLVGLKDPVTVLGVTDDLTRQIDKVLQKRGAGRVS